MELIHQLLDFIAHIDVYLQTWVVQYDSLTYLFLALIIFCETGLVFTPFLPGDSLLFAAGMIAAQGALSLPLLIIILFAAALLGDNCNYFIGSFIGHKIIAAKRTLIKKEYLNRTHAFYEKHGGKAIIIARFVPIVRTFAPFVAGLGTMTYRKFILFCVAGNALWIVGFSVLGYAFGNHPTVKQNFSLVILGIIVLSLLPMIIAFIRNYFSKEKTV